MPASLPPTPASFVTTCLGRVRLVASASALLLILLSGCASMHPAASSSSSTGTSQGAASATEADRASSASAHTGHDQHAATNSGLAGSTASSASSSGSSSASKARPTPSAKQGDGLEGDAEDAETARLLLEADQMGDTHEPPAPQTYPDIWARIRAGFAMPELQDDERVQTHERLYSNKQDYWARITERAGRYLFHIVEQIERRNMPTELALLPVIESAFNPRAQSVAKAAGMWQFIPSTGKHYDLKQNLFSDERRDVIASTNAALNYLARLHEMFDDWHLALAAYNWGEGSVQRAIQRNRAQGLPTDYANLRMPNETRNYVPKLLAVKHLIANPEKFGITLPPIPDNPYFTTVVIRRDMDTDLIARLAGITLERFQELNPSYKRPMVLGELEPEVLLPYDNAISFQNNLSKYRGPLCSWKVIKLANNAPVTELVRQWQMDEDRFRSVNEVPHGHTIKSGSVVLVTKQPGDYSNTKAELAEDAALVLVADPPSVLRTVHVVRKGDTLQGIARRYNTTMGMILKGNRLRSRTLHVGQKLVIERPVRPPARAKPRPPTVIPKVKVAAGGKAVPVVTVKATKAAPAKPPTRLSNQSPRTSKAAAARKPSNATTQKAAKAATKAAAKPASKPARKPVAKSAEKPTGKSAAQLANNP